MRRPGKKSIAISAADLDRALVPPPAAGSTITSRSLDETIEANALPPEGDKIIRSAEKRLGCQVLYASAYGREDSSPALMSALRNSEPKLAAGIPKAGWLIATEHHLCVYAKSVAGGIGKKKGHIPVELVRGLKVDHQKNDKKSVVLEFTDGSTAALVFTTKATAGACSPWLRVLSGEKAASPASRRAQREQKFDADLLFEMSSVSH